MPEDVYAVDACNRPEAQHIGWNKSRSRDMAANTLMTF